MYSKLFGKMPEEEAKKEKQEDKAYQENFCLEVGFIKCEEEEKKKRIYRYIHDTLLYAV